MNQDELLRQAQAMQEELVVMRRDLHRNPELSFQEARTAAKGQAWFRELGLDVEADIAHTHGLVATLDTGRPGPTLLIRGDIDALPIVEETDVEYASENPGVMHACGHDVHTTCTMGAAKLLVKNKARLRGRIKFLLQPGEESPPGGAKIMVEQGKILEGVDAALALHVHAGLAAGTLGFRPGQVLAYSSRFLIRIIGVGGHAARPHQAVDSVAVAVQVYQALQYLVSRESNPVEAFVITIGMINGGTAPNVIAGQVEMKGTARCINDEQAAALPAKMERVIKGLCEATRAKYEFEFLHGYPALVNDVPFTERAMAGARALLGEQAVVVFPHPEMGGEDFSYIAREVPSVFFRLGVGNEARGIVHPVHSSKFDVDETALPIGVAALAYIAMEYLNGGR
ncbi:MAG: amidohydrolase [SAR324 cluster bacterium]|nr:amidohydrolase [SAR324 cluster bacterium]